MVEAAQEGLTRLVNENELVPQESLALPPPRLELRGITKRYPGVLANDGISLTVARGGVHALLGENGAGKSTLVKIIYGVMRPDAGQLIWEGEAVELHSPAEARRLGIGMVFQHFNLFDTLTVADNIALGTDKSSDRRGLADRLSEIADRYGLPVDPKRHVHSLSVGERQRVEIVRALLQNPKLLILDEPTSVLTPQEADRLFETLRRLSADGCSILYISHKLQEIRDLCDDATVLRSGKVVGTCDPRSETPRTLAEMMIGREIPVVRRSSAAERGPVQLQVRGLSLPAADPFGVSLQHAELMVRGGEIVGLAGVTGNGQKELLMALSGERIVRDNQAVSIAGKACGRAGPKARRELGLAFVPEERLGRGAVPELSLSDNVLLTGYFSRLVHRGFVRRERVRKFAEHVVRAFNVKANGIDSEARSLSGGNLQRFILGREINLAPKILILAYPTWGVDVGAATAIHRAIMDLKERGTGVLIVSEDLDELFELCDRLMVIADGRVSPSVNNGDMTAEQVGVWMGGGFEGAKAPDAPRAIAHAASS